MDEDGSKWMILLDLFTWGYVRHTHGCIYESKELLRVHACPDVEWCNIQHLNIYQNWASRVQTQEMLAWVATRVQIYIHHANKSLGDLFEL